MDHRTNNKVFGEYARYYDLFYRGKDYAAEAEYVRRLLTRLGVYDGAILEFGAGTGRHGRLLADVGFRVHGIEISASMVELARASGSQPRFSITQGDIRDVRLSQKFNVVTALFHVVSYQTTNEDVLLTFNSARAHLEAGGVFLFDVWYAPAVITQTPSVRETRFEDNDISIVRRAEPKWDVNRNLVDVRYVVQETKKETAQTVEFDEIHPMRYFSLLELDLFASASGFRREIAEEFLSGGPLSTETWGACIAMCAI